MPLSTLITVAGPEKYYAYAHDEIRILHRVVA